MKKNSTYVIDGNLYMFSRAKFRQLITAQNPNRSALEQFYRKVEALDIGISYETVKSWVKREVNPNLEDVKRIAEVLGTNYMNLLTCTHYGAEVVKTRIQKINFAEVLDPFSFRYEGFSNVLDMIIGIGYNESKGEEKIADFAERIISILGINEHTERELPELLGYKFQYTEDEIRRMSAEDIEKALILGYVDDEGNSLYDENGKLSIDRKKFGERLLKNITWLDDEDYALLRSVIIEAGEWWDHCEMPFALLKVDINVCGHRKASFTYGPGWSKPTHEDRWRLILDILTLLGTNLDTTGLCWIREMHVDQFESEMYLTIEAFKHFK